MNPQVILMILQMMAQRSKEQRAGQDAAREKLLSQTGATDWVPRKSNFMQNMMTESKGLKNALFDSSKPKDLFGQSGAFSNLTGALKDMGSFSGYDKVSGLSDLGGNGLDASSALLTDKGATENLTSSLGNTGGKSMIANAGQTLGFLQMLASMGGNQQNNRPQIQPDSWSAYMGRI